MLPGQQPQVCQSLVSTVSFESHHLKVIIRSSGESGAERQGTSGICKSDDMMHGPDRGCRSSFHKLAQLARPRFVALISHRLSIVDGMPKSRREWASKECDER